jgi:hypothetical protein
LPAISTRSPSEMHFGRRANSRQSGLPSGKAVTSNAAMKYPKAAEVTDHRGDDIRGRGRVGLLIVYSEYLGVAIDDEPGLTLDGIVRVIGVFENHLGFHCLAGLRRGHDDCSQIEVLQFGNNSLESIQSLGSCQCFFDGFGIRGQGERLVYGQLLNRQADVVPETFCLETGIKGVAILLLPVFIAGEGEVRCHVIADEFGFGLFVVFGLEVNESGLSVLIHEERDIIPSEALVD